MALRLTAQLVYFGLSVIERLVDWRDARRKAKRAAQAKREIKAPL
jgi:hypothetical protein